MGVCFPYEHCGLRCAAVQDRVTDVMHSFKLVATLQYVANKSSSQTNPLVLRLIDREGHDINSVEWFEMFCFAAEVCGAKWCWSW
jgi:hypothetical protein